VFVSDFDPKKIATFIRYLYQKIANN